jgi:hypothetical protein
MMEVKITVDVEDKCKSCNKPMIASEIPINPYWGTEQQVKAQGVVVAQGFYSVSGSCKDCVEHNKIIAKCHECDKPISQDQIGVIMVGQYAEGEADIYCKTCYGKWTRHKLETFIREGAQVEFPR